MSKNNMNKNNENNESDLLKVINIEVNKLKHLVDTYYNNKQHNKNWPNLINKLFGIVGEIVFNESKSNKGSVFLLAGNGNKGSILIEGQEHEIIRLLTQLSEEGKELMQKASIMSRLLDNDDEEDSFN